MVNEETNTRSILGILCDCSVSQVTRLMKGCLTMKGCLRSSTPKGYLAPEGTQQCLGSSIMLGNLLILNMVFLLLGSILISLVYGLTWIFNLGEGI